MRRKFGHVQLRVYLNCCAHHVNQLSYAMRLLTDRASMVSTGGRHTAHGMTPVQLPAAATHVMFTLLVLSCTEPGEKDVSAGVAL